MEPFVRVEPTTDGLQIQFGSFGSVRFRAARRYG